jgi:hypothetical protein
MMKKYIISIMLVFSGCTDSGKEIIYVEPPTVEEDEEVVEEDTTTVIPPIVDDDSGGDLIGGDQIEEPEEVEIQGKESMDKGKEYRLYRGDKIIEEDDAVLKITRNAEESYTKVQLISGSATIYYRD